MTAFNAVRFRVTPGRDQGSLDGYKHIGETWPGLMHANIIKTGDHSYCIIGEGRHRRVHQGCCGHDLKTRLIP